jgi:hypothetical protein
MASGPYVCTPMDHGLAISEREKREWLQMLSQSVDLITYVMARLEQQPVGSEVKEHYSTRSLVGKPSTNVRGLRKKIKEVLQQAGRPLRSTEITDALYHPSLGISRDRFNRRVIVSVSAMFKEGKDDVYKVEMNGRDALWTVTKPCHSVSDTREGDKRNEERSIVLPSRIK